MGVFKEAEYRQKQFHESVGIPESCHTEQPAFTMRWWGFCRNDHHFMLEYLVTAVVPNRLKATLCIKLSRMFLLFIVYLNLSLK